MYSARKFDQVQPGLRDSGPSGPSFGCANSMKVAALAKEPRVRPIVFWA